MMKCFYLNGNPSSDFGIYINSDTYLDAPSFDYTEYEIPGVHGNSIQYNKRLNNVVRKFECYINKNCVDNLALLKKLIYSNPGYLQIESDYDPGYIQFGYLAEEINVTPFLSDPQNVQFTLYFSCRPQRYYDEPEVTASSVKINTFEYSIFPKTHPVIRQLLSQIKYGYQPPETDYFIVYHIGQGNNVSSPQKWIDIVAPQGVEWDALAWTRPLESDDYFFGKMPFLRGTGRGGVTHYSGLLPTLGEHYAIYPLVYSGKFEISYDGVSDPGTEISTAVTTMSNNKALGFVPYDISIEYTGLDQVAQGVQYPNQVIFASYLNGQKQNEMVVTLRTDLMSNELLTDIATNYLRDGKATINCDFTNMYFSLWSNMPELDVSNFIQVNGEIDYGDEIRVALFETDTLNASYVSILPQWWMV